MNKKGLLLMQIRKTSHRIQRYKQEIAESHSTYKNIYLGILAILTVPFLAGYKAGKKISTNPVSWIPLLMSLFNILQLHTSKKDNTDKMLTR